jgi:hypothetical protein
MRQQLLDMDHGCVGTVVERWFCSFPMDDNLPRRGTLCFVPRDFMNGRLPDIVKQPAHLLVLQVDPYNRLTPDQQYASNVLSRAHSFLAMLETDPEVERLRMEPFQFLAVAMAGTMLPSAVSEAAKDCFPQTSRAAQVCRLDCGCRSVVQLNRNPLSMCTC